MEFAGAFVEGGSEYDGAGLSRPEGKRIDAVRSNSSRLARHRRIYRQCSTLTEGDDPTSLTSPSQALTLPENGNSIPHWRVAVEAAESRKAMDIRVLDLQAVTTFTDYFLICSVTNPRQGQAVCDEIGRQLKDLNDRPISLEGYDAAEWILMDYGDFIVHIFSVTARSYYDLERLWRHAKVLELPAQLNPATLAVVPSQTV